MKKSAPKKRPIKAVQPTARRPVGQAALANRTAASLRAAASKRVRPAQPLSDPTEHAQPPEPRGGPCVVGIGASAGGLEPIKTFLSKLPSNSGLVFVVVQHLDPTHKSLAVELYSKRTEMPVTTAGEGVRVQADQVYVVPPGQEATIAGGVLHLFPLEKARGPRMPIDRFFQSLGEDQQQRAIGIVLSGTGADGALGLKSIVGNGGIVLAQRPDTAQFDGMPRAALATGLVTHVTTVEEMPGVVVHYARHPYAARPDQPGAKPEVQESLLRAILEFVRARRGYDFSGYKRATLLRRIHRRMGLLYIESMADYAVRLRQEPQEVEALFRDLLIGATEFFRDAEAWKTLTTKVLDPLVAARANDEAIRVWVAGTSTGEEAYTLAMLLTESLEKARKRCLVQIFATDTSEEALAVARMGVYPAGIAAQMSVTRLHRFFNEIDEGRHWQVNAELRGRVVFGVQNLFSDPPFSGVDLLSCRNVMIYLEPDVQRRVLLLLHFALKPDGALFLGGAETAGAREDLFIPLSKSARIYRRIGSTPREQLEFRAPQAGGAPHQAAGYRSRPSAPQLLQASRLAQQMIFDRLAPAAVLVDRGHEVLYFSGPTDRFLTHPHGAPTSNLLALAREGLRSRLRGALAEAAAANTTVVADDAQVKRRGRYEGVRLTVIPTIGGGAEPLYLVGFEDRAERSRQPRTDQRETSLVKRLEDELYVTREDLRATVEGLETSNEELKAANEEVVSINEELQSSNEELQSSKEELQSLNEELNTVNQQLQGKVSELETANNDLHNLLASNEVATLCLDPDLHIKWFSPAARNVLGLIASDIGRPVTVFASSLMGDPLVEDAQAVLSKLAATQRESKGEGERWFLRRTLPYRTDDKRVDGVIITFTDITDSKLASEALVEAGMAATAELARRVEERTRQLRQLAFELTRAEESERQAIARDLHDELAQLLAVAKLQLDRSKADASVDWARMVGDVGELLGRAEASVRSLAFQLSPAVLYELGLTPALQWLSDEMHKTYGLSVDVDDDGADKPLEPDFRAIVFRVVRELLINVVRHARVSRAYVTLQRVDGELQISVGDDGQGFDPARADSPGRGGFGLTGVRERLSFIGGRLVIVSEPGQGTEITLQVPLSTVQETAALLAAPEGPDGRPG